MRHFSRHSVAITLILGSLIVAGCGEFHTPPPASDRAGSGGGQGRSGGISGTTDPDPGTTGGSGSASPTDGPAGAGSGGCPAGQHNCNGGCVDDKSPMNCGVSCDACPQIAGGDATCDGTKCGVTCPAGKKPCLSLNQCVGMDEACAGTCPDGKNPCNGLCVDPKTKTACGSACTVCPTAVNGTTDCDGTQCTLTCNPGFHRCDDKCLANDQVASCGMSCTPCAKAMDGDAACANGVCQLTCPTGKVLCKGTGACLAPGQPCDGMCPSGKHDCNNNCVADTDVNACGANCTKCMAPSGMAVCSNGKCDFNCAAGTHKCNGGCYDCCTNTDCPAKGNQTATCTANGTCSYSCPGAKNCNGTCAACCDGDPKTCGPNNCGTMGTQICKGGSFGPCSAKTLDCCGPVPCTNNCQKDGTHACNNGTIAKACSGDVADPACCTDGVSCTGAGSLLTCKGGKATKSTCASKVCADSTTCADPDCRMGYTCPNATRCDEQTGKCEPCGTAGIQCCFTPQKQCVNDKLVCFATSGMCQPCGEEVSAPCCGAPFFDSNLSKCNASKSLKCYRNRAGSGTCSHCGDPGDICCDGATPCRGSMCTPGVVPTDPPRCM